MWTLYLMLSCAVAAATGAAVVGSTHKHGVLSADSDLSGPQKIHLTPVPRIGGVAIMMGTLAGAVLMAFLDSASSRMIWSLVACSVPAFGIGLFEDLTKRVSPKVRLSFIALAALIGALAVDIVVSRTGIPGVDSIFAFAPVAVIFTVFAVAGVSNAVNIVDGLNGLASMCVILMLVGLSCICFSVGDSSLGLSALVILGATVGFFVLNFPGGKIFLGDGGAYLLGFLYAELAILLISRNREVSVLCPVLMCAYPIVETLFSVYRRRVLMGTSPSQPDGLHLHTLLYKRLVRTVGKEERNATLENSLTSPYLWLLCSVSIVPAIVFSGSTLWLAVSFAVFVFVYVSLYWRVVRFQTPRWLRARDRARR